MEWVAKTGWCIRLQNFTHCQFWRTSNHIQNHNVLTASIVTGQISQLCWHTWPTYCGGHSWHRVAQAGYCADYQNKRLPIGVHEILEWIKAQQAMIQRLLEAKAAVDAQNNKGRSLGGFGAKTSWEWDLCEQVDWNSSGSRFSWIVCSFYQKPSETLHQKDVFFFLRPHLLSCLGFHFLFWNIFELSKKVRWPPKFKCLHLT